jgi:hypothetical protein
MGACPGSAPIDIPADRQPVDQNTISGASELRQWPIQLQLVSPHAPYFQGTHLLIAADCTPFALGSFHQALLKAKKLIIVCPKLDNTDGYIEKLTEIIKQNNLKSLTPAIMTVPCCSGLYQIVLRAVELSAIDLTIQKTVIHIDASQVA